VHSAGDDLISIPAKGPRAAQALAEGLRETGDWIDVVAGLDSVVVRFDIAKMQHDDAEELLARGVGSISASLPETSQVIEIPIVYGGEAGPDFGLICEQLGLTRDELIDLHCGEYTVDMLGFTPGFAYIGGLDSRLAIDRLEQPRQFIPAGSIGIAGGRTGLYSLPGPGGWPLIGKTSVTLFDANSDNPFTLSAGAKVVFTAANK
jgi:KipI family sensor histidine kinase inhibitor